MTYWPAEWCVSFKHTLIPRWPLNFFKVPPLPADTRVVCFTGLPNPDHARDGVWPSKRKAWWKPLYKHVRPDALDRGALALTADESPGSDAPMRVLILSDGVAGHDRSSLGILTALSETPSGRGAVSCRSARRASFRAA